jgi:hypothetical protein
MVAKNKKPPSHILTPSDLPIKGASKSMVASAATPSSLSGKRETHKQNRLTTNLKESFVHIIITK